MSEEKKPEEKKTEEKKDEKMEVDQEQKKEGEEEKKVDVKDNRAPNVEKDTGKAAAHVKNKLEDESEEAVTRELPKTNKEDNNDNKTR